MLLDIPGVRGIRILYTPAEIDVPPTLIDHAIRLLRHWLQHCRKPINHRVIRHALRQLHAPMVLGETELAKAIFAPISNNIERGLALQSLLIDAIKQLQSDGGISDRQYRSYLILYNLYILQRNRRRITADLGLSERQYQRELNIALTRLAQFLTP